MRMERQLAAVLDESVPDSSPIGRLAAAAREIASIDEPDELTSAIPELARTLCSATGVALLRVGASGRIEFLAGAGAPLQAEADRLLAMARAVLGSQAESRNDDPPCSTDGAHRLVVLPLADGGREPLLAIQRKPPDECLSESDLEHLAVYAFFARTAFARARAAATLRETVAREAATLRAVRDGVIALDRSGTVRVLNQCAATALGLKREEIVGRVLREVPGLAALASALAGGPDMAPGLVPVPRGRVAIRSQVHEGGIVATVRDLASEPADGQRPANARRYTFRDFVGKHPALVQVLEDARRAAQLDLPILISGESGTGKELLAQAIHGASPRASAPFVGINVMAIPRELLESELFGYEGGAFTGARSSGRTGSFGEAGRGTLLLDEIGDMPLDMQGKLLRVLQERVVQRVGGASREVPVLARVIATTNCDLEQAVKAGRFRLDLFHRLRVVHLHLPALRERKGDVRLLLQHQLSLHAERSERGPVTVEPAVLAAMEAYDWPGNVRELLNVVEGELALLPARRNALSVVPRALRRQAGGSWDSSPARPAETEPVPLLSETVRKACREAIARHRGNVASAARALGIAKGTLYRKISASHAPDVPDREPASKPARDPQR